MFKLFLIILSSAILLCSSGCSVRNVRNGTLSEVVYKGESRPYEKIISADEMEMIVRNYNFARSMVDQEKFNEAKKLISQSIDFLEGVVGPYNYWKGGFHYLLSVIANKENDNKKAIEEANIARYIYIENINPNYPGPIVLLDGWIAQLNNEGDKNRQEEPTYKGKPTADEILKDLDNILKDFLKRYEKYGNRASSEINNK